MTDDTRRRSSNRPRILAHLLFLLVFAGLALWAHGFFLYKDAVLSMTPQQPAQKTDAIVVLTGGKGRIDTGFALLEQGLADKVFVSGVYQGVEVQELLARWDSSGRDLSCCIALGYASSNTYENAIETALWAERERVQSLRLVTSNYHMPRALLEFQALMPGIAILSHPVPAEGLNRNNALQDRKNRLILFREYNKLLVIALWQGLHGLHLRFSGKDAPP